MGHVQRAINVVIVTLIVLILAIVVYFLWNLIVVRLLGGPALSYAEIVLIIAIISVGAWDIVVLPRRAATTP